MSLQRQIGFWIGCLVALILFVYLFSGVLTPFIAALILAYLLDPAVDRLEKFGLSRLLSTCILVVGCLLIFVLVLVIAVPIIANQTAAFLAKVPAYSVRLQALLSEYGGPLIERFGGPDRLKEIQASLGAGLGEGAKWAGSLIASLASSGGTVIGVISLLVLTPVITFYLLLDWDHMVARIDDCLPLDHRATIRQLATEMDQSVAGFIRGQALLCLILGLFYAVGLALIGLNFGFLIGILAGFISFVPFVGSITGFLVAGGVAIAQFWPEYWMVVAVLAIFGIGQFVEGNILQPKLLGEAVGLHPVWLMFALLAAGSLLGFVGVLLAVPLAAVIGVLVRFFLRQYLESRYYHGQGRRADAGSKPPAA
jgi:predicted PurR-regulated permease PerM